MHRKSFVISLALGCAIILGSGKTDAGQIPDRGPKATRLVKGLRGGSGSTIGHDGALYVTEGAASRISRVDPHTGAITTFARGLPKRGFPDYPFGGAVDVAFLGKTTYVLVAVVGPNDVVGIYRVDGPDRFTVVADIGAFSV